MAPTGPAALPRPDVEPTHPCIRCGRPGVPAEAGLCELCNPLELAQPSATQVHGIAALGIIVFIAVLAVLGRAAFAGVGPFAGTVDDVQATPAGLAITLTVENRGAKAAATSCRISQVGASIGAPTPLVQSPLIAAGGQVQFTATVTQFGTSPVPLSADCGPS